MDFTTEFDELSNLKKPPQKLYYKGDLSLMQKTKIAIVGSRKCSKYTKNLIISLANTLKNYDICVVSGAAIGSDIYAHEAAFPNTIAVFGNGLNQIYPTQNTKIIQQIYTNALALSEYEPDFKATAWSFLERNRIVVGLSKALIIAQADLKSGSMASAKIALNLGIPIFVLPQRIGESNGTNELLKSKKANLITDFDEFASIFGDKQISQKDEILEFISQNSDFEKCFEKFGAKLYEYELDGKIAIDGVFVRVL